MRIAIVIALFVGSLIGAITAMTYHSRDDVWHRNGIVRVQCPPRFRAEDSCRAISDFARGGWTFTVTTVNP